jgi:hypothetical protein
MARAEAYSSCQNGAGQWLAKVSVNETHISIDEKTEKPRRSEERTGWSSVSGAPPASEMHHPAQHERDGRVLARERYPCLPINQDASFVPTPSPRLLDPTAWHAARPHSRHAVEL